MQAARRRYHAPLRPAIRREDEMRVGAMGPAAGAEDTGGARVVPIPPPAIYAVPLAATLALHRAVPLTIPGRPGSALAGAALVGAGALLDVAAVATVIGHRTTIVPHRPVARLLTRGPFRVSRNPMYTGLAGAYVGIALVAGSWWPLLALPLVVTAIRVFVIAPEESYLSGRFGPAYAAYRRRVRRWI